LTGLLLGPVDPHFNRVAAEGVGFVKQLGQLNLRRVVVVAVVMVVVVGVWCVTRTRTRRRRFFLGGAKRLSAGSIDDFIHGAKRR
jgi:hypothetical protein